MAEQKYKRLTREKTPMRLTAFASRSSLWLGDDHLLLVQSTSFTETYKRFFFRDIQVFTMRKTPARAVWNWIWGTFLGLSAIGIVVGVSSDGWGTGATVFTGIFLVIFGLPLLINTLLGPICVCEIRTAVQTEELPSLRRVRQTRKVLDRIRPLIAAAQGQFTAEEVAARMRETIAEGTAPQATEPPLQGDLPPVTS